MSANEYFAIKFMSAAFTIGLGVVIGYVLSDDFKENPVTMLVAVVIPSIVLALLWTLAGYPWGG